MNKFTFKEYQSKASETAIYGDSIEKLIEDIFPGPGKQQVIRLLKLCYVSLGLGEVGELQGKVKKIIRDCPRGMVSQIDKDKIGAELGDILWYVAQMCRELGIDMGEVAEKNIEKLISRKERGVLRGSGDDR